MRIELETITPQRAKNILKDNIANNRPIRSTRVAGYAHDMRNNKWHLTGDTIKFDTKGEFIDGQHRLSAIIESGVAVQMYVAYDVEVEALNVIDTGKSRTFADSLAFQEIPDGNRVAAVVKWHLMWKLGCPTNKISTRMVTPAALMTEFKKDPANFVEAAKRANDLRRAGVTGNIAAGIAFYLFNRLSPEMAHSFFDQLVTGADMHKESPVLVLRNTLMKTSEARRFKPAEIFALFIRAWNNFIEDRNVTVLYSNGTDKRPLNNSNFPAIRSPKA